MSGGRLFRVLGLLPGDVLPPPRTGRALSPALSPPSAQASLPHMCVRHWTASRPNLTSLLRVHTCLCCQETVFFMLRTSLALPPAPGSVVLLRVPHAWAREAGPRLAGGSQSLAAHSPLRVIPPPFLTSFLWSCCPVALPTGQVRPRRASRSLPALPGPCTHPLSGSLAQPCPSFISSCLPVPVFQPPVVGIFVP